MGVVVSGSARRELRRIPQQAHLEVVVHRGERPSTATAAPWRDARWVSPSRAVWIVSLDDAGAEAVDAWAASLESHVTTADVTVRALRGARSSPGLDALTASPVCALLVYRPLGRDIPTATLRDAVPAAVEALSVAESGELVVAGSSVEVDVPVDALVEALCAVPSGAAVLRGAWGFVAVSVSTSGRMGWLGVTVDVGLGRWPVTDVAARLVELGAEVASPVDYRVVTTEPSGRNTVLGYKNADRSWSDHRLARRFDVPIGWFPHQTLPAGTTVEADHAVWAVSSTSAGVDVVARDLVGALGAGVAGGPPLPPFDVERGA